MNLQGFVSANNRTLPPSFAMQKPPVSPAGSGTSGSALSVGKADSSPEGRALLSPTLGEVDCVARRRGLGFALLPPGGRQSRARFFFVIFYYNKASNLEILTFICYNNHNVSKRQQSLFAAENGNYK